jgi:hypothetical protein
LISLLDSTRARATELVAPAIDFYTEHAPALRHRILGGWSAVLTAVVVLVILAQNLWAGFVWLLPRLAALLQRTGGALAAADRWIQDQAMDPVLAAISEQLPEIDEPAEPIVVPGPSRPARTSRRTRTKAAARG